MIIDFIVDHETLEVLVEIAVELFFGMVLFCVYLASLPSKGFFNIVNMAFGLVLFCVGLWITVVFLMLNISISRLDNNENMAVANIASLHLLGVDYQFVTQDNKTINSHHYVAYNTIKMLKPGGSVAVTYNIDDPTESKIIGDNFQMVFNIVLIMCGFLILILAFIILYREYRNGTIKRQLCERGSIVDGHITKIINNTYTRTIEYEFNDNLGKVHIGRAKVSISLVKPKHNKDKTIHVIYLVETPHRNTILENMVLCCKRLQAVECDNSKNKDVRNENGRNKYKGVKRNVSGYFE